MVTRATSTAMFENGTGFTWEQWLEYLAQHQAERLAHSEVVSLAVAKIAELGVAEKVEWWAQGVAVAYGQHLGRRKPGQAVNGQWRVGASKTINLPGAEALAAWEEFLATRGTEKLKFNEVAWEGPGRASRTAQWFYWRCDLADGSKVSVNIQTKAAEDKSSVGVEHRNLAQGEAGIEPWKIYWRGILGDFARFVSQK